MKTALAASDDVKHDAQLVVRLSQDLLDRVDAYAKRLEAESGFQGLSRADVVRKLLADALTSAEATGKRKKR